MKHASEGAYIFYSLHSLLQRGEHGRACGFQEPRPALCVPALADLDMAPGPLVTVHTQLIQNLCSLGGHDGLKEEGRLAGGLHCVPEHSVQAVLAAGLLGQLPWRGVREVGVGLFRIS